MSLSTWLVILFIVKLCFFFSLYCIIEKVIPLIILWIYRGIYLASILYHEDKILVTNEDFLPIIEIDESYPSSLHNDFHWLMKVCIRLSLNFHYLDI